jgi:hypothetical protein
MKIKELLEKMKTEDYSKTDRTWFNESFLSESPQRHSPAEYFENILFSINDYIEYGIIPINLGKINDFDFCKIDLNDSVYYWFEKNKEILLGVELSKKKYTWQIHLLGKKISGPPYAVDMYCAILNDSGKNITIMSDDQLTDKGFKIWNRLFNMGHKILVYDKNKPGISMKAINSASDLELYFGDDIENKNYRYVLVEQHYIGETRGFFNVRRSREKLKLFLED